MVELPRRSSPVEAAVRRDASRLAVAGRAGVGSVVVLVGVGQAVSDGADVTPAAAALVFVGIVLWHAALVVMVYRDHGELAAGTDAVVVAALGVGALPAAQAATVPTGYDWVAALGPVAAIFAQWYSRPPVGAVVALALAGAAAVDAVAYDGESPGATRGHVAWVLLQSLLSRLLVIVVAGRARIVDQRAASLGRARGAEHAASTRRAEIEEHAALLHDTVAATLGAAATSRGDAGPLPDQARLDLDRLTAAGLLGADASGADSDTGSAEPPPDAGRGIPGVGTAGDDWVQALAATPPGCTVGVRLDDTDLTAAVAAGVPPDVRTALVEATTEAVRNADRHAGAGEVRVTVRRVAGAGVADEGDAPSASDGVAVDVVDDGSGFDVAAVPDGRLGIRLSVVARMRRAGGSALVRSNAGRGTTVELRWPATRT